MYTMQLSLMAQHASSVSEINVHSQDNKGFALLSEFLLRLLTAWLPFPCQVSTAICLVASCIIFSGIIYSFVCVSFLVRKAHSFGAGFSIASRETSVLGQNEQYKFLSHRFEIALFQLFRVKIDRQIQVRETEYCVMKVT
jgi:hypothetical protein